MRLGSKNRGRFEPDRLLVVPDIATTALRKHQKAPAQVSAAWRAGAYQGDSRAEPIRISFELNFRFSEIFVASKVARIEKRLYFQRLYA
jgi:hypothetical protein